MAIRPPNYRLPDDTSVGGVKLQISNLERSLAFYTQILGLHIIEKSGAVARLGAEGSTTALVELHEDKAVSAVPRRGLLGLFHFAILLPDRAAPPARRAG